MQNPRSSDPKTSYQPNDIAQILVSKDQQIEELKKLIYIASHDIRSPLLSILGFADELEMMSDDIRDIFSGDKSVDQLKKEVFALLDTDAEETVHYVRSSIGKLDSMIHSLLILSRAAHAEINHSEINMDHLLNRVRMEFSSRLSSQKTTLTIEPLLPCYADETGLTRILEIVLENSLAHQAEKDKKQIEIISREEEHAIAYIIKDKNSTLEDKRREEVFEVFRKLNPNNLTGAGISLPEARTWIRKMDGSICIEQASKHGCTTVLRLPKIKKP